MQMNDFFCFQRFFFYDSLQSPQCLKNDQNPVFQIYAKNGKNCIQTASSTKNAKISTFDDFFSNSQPSCHISEICCSKQFFTNLYLSNCVVEPRARALAVFTFIKEKSFNASEFLICKNKNPWLENPSKVLMSESNSINFRGDQ